MALLPFNIYFIRRGTMFRDKTHSVRISQKDKCQSQNFVILETKICPASNCVFRMVLNEDIRKSIWRRAMLSEFCYSWDWRTRAWPSFLWTRRWWNSVISTGSKSRRHLKALTEKERKKGSRCIDIKREARNMLSTLTNML